MDMQKILAELDQLYGTGDRKKVELYLAEQSRSAEEEGDWGTQIMLNNEMMGLYRETGQTKQAIALFNRTKEIFMDHAMLDTVPYASTLQNAANAFRVDGQLGESIILFEEALDIYNHFLDENDYRFAGLFNNLSLLYLEKGETWRAREYSEKALGIIEKLPDTVIEQATNHVNLANLYCQTQEIDKAKEHLKQADRLFAVSDYKDPHVSSMWSAWGQVQLEEQNPQEAELSFRKARDEVEKYFGKSRAYAAITKNLALALKRQGRKDAAEEEMKAAKKVLEALGIRD